MNTKKIVIGLSILMALFFLTSCAPAGMTATEYGFFWGLVHGFIFPFVLIAKLCGAHVGLYAEHNTGLLYWVGFILGIGVLLGGGGGGAVRSRR